MKDTILNKKIFGVLHVTEIWSNMDNNAPICPHTKYGNLYVIKKDKSDFENPGSACFNCCMQSLCDSNCCCVMRFIDKYRKNNTKVLKKIIVDKIEEMKISYPDTDWKEFFERKIKINLNKNDK